MITTAKSLTAMLVGLSLGGAGAARAGTLPTTSFDWNPRPLHLDGSKFTADTVILSDYGQIVIDPATGAFSEAGYLPILGFSLNGRALTNPGGFGSSWGAFVRYQGAGTQAMTAAGLVASYSSLSYSIYGFNGTVNYGLDPQGVAYAVGGSDFTRLGDGSLLCATCGSLTLVPTAFAGSTPIAFFADGEIQASIADVPRQFSSNTFLGFDLNIVHLPGELFPVSPTVIEADGGSSSTAVLLASRGNSSHGLVFASSADSASLDPAVAVPEPASLALLAAGAIPVLARRRRQRAWQV